MPMHIFVMASLIILCERLHQSLPCSSFRSFITIFHFLLVARQIMDLWLLLRFMGMTLLVARVRLCVGS